MRKWTFIYCAFPVLKYKKKAWCLSGSHWSGYHNPEVLLSYSVYTTAYSYDNKVHLRYGWYYSHDQSRLPGYADIVVSHEAPLAFSPVPMRPDNAEITSDTWEKVIAGRTYLNHVLNEIRMTRWFYGHHHQSFSGHYGNVLYRGLGINELFGLCGE